MARIGPTTLSQRRQELSPDQRKALKKAYKAAASLMPNLDESWAAWPSILIGYGLGKELGAVPRVAPGSGLVANQNTSNVLDTVSQHDLEPCN